MSRSPSACQPFAHTSYLTVARSFRSIKSGKVVVLLAGRYAGRKAVVIKAHDEGTDGKKFGHAIGKSVFGLCLWCFPGLIWGSGSLVAGIDRYPRKVTKSMGKAKLAKRSKVKPFIKAVNYSHVMPTRCVFALFQALKPWNFCVPKVMLTGG